MREIEFRIVTDNYAGYEVQFRTWYWPFWRQAEFSNTFHSVDKAKEFIEEYKKKYYFKSQVIESDL